MNTFRLLGAALLLAPLAYRPATAQALDPTFASPASLYAPGDAYALGPPQADGKRLVSGYFTRINGTAVNSQLVRLDANGGLDLPFLQNVGVAYNVYRMAATPTGQYMLFANGSLEASGLTRNELLRLNANGTADASFDVGTGPNGTALGYGYSQDFAVQPNGQVLTTGSFDEYSGAVARGVVRLNANGSVDNTFSVGAGIDTNSTTDYNIGNAVAVQPDGRVLVGGAFDTFDGQPKVALVRVSATGRPDPSFANPFLAGSSVDGLVLQPDGKVLVYGQLTTNGGSTLGLVRLNANGSLDAGFAPPTLGAITTYGADRAVVLQPDGKILACGVFNVAGARRVVRLNANGSQDATFAVNAGPDDAPATIGLQPNGSVLVGGYFNNFAGRETHLAQLTPTGAVDLAFAPTLQIPGNVSAVARQADGKLLVGGTFTEYAGQPVHRLVRMLPSGALETAYAAATGTLPGPVTCLAVQADGKALVGTNRSVVRLGTGGTPDPGFAATAFGATALALQPNGQALVGSNYYAPGSGGRAAIRLNLNGTTDASFRVASAGPGLGNSANTTALLVQPDGKVVLAAQYSGVGPMALTGLVRYDATGGLDPSFSTGNTFFFGASSTARINALALQPDGRILAGGRFSDINGQPRANLARFGTNGVLDPGFASNALHTGSVLCLAVQPNGRVLLGGSFTSTAPAHSLNNLARVLANGQDDVSFASTANPNGTVRSLLVQPDGAIVLAGSFGTVGGQLARYVARITAPNVLAVAAPAAVAARTAAWPVPAHGLLHVLPDFGARPLTVELLDALGRPLLAQPAAAATETVLDLSNRPAGVYLLRVQYAAGTVVRRVVVE